VFLGGRDNLRGWKSERFAGDAGAWGSAEVRFRLARLRGPLPGEVGAYGLADVGRVWLDGESEGGWHGGVGGGLWLALVDRSNTVAVGFAHSREGTVIYAGLDFPY
jgi:hemolysin activation/secretion protein